MSYAGQCYQSSIVSPTPFMGNNDEVFKLLDNSVWKVNFSYEYMYAYSPSVVVCPSEGKLLVNGRDIYVTQLSLPQAKKSIKDQQVDLIESQIDGDFEGWSGDTIFKLTNGQIWQQTGYSYTYTYKFMPKVMLIPINGGYELQVEGMDQRIRVSKLK
jgi:hypothetical protein